MAVMNIRSLLLPKKLKLLVDSLEKPKQPPAWETVV